MAGDPSSPSPRVGVGQKPACNHTDGWPEAWGQVALAQNYAVELDSSGVLMPKPVFSVSTLDRKLSWMGPWGPSLASHVLSAGLLLGGGYPVSCFTHNVHLILTEPQEVCSITPPPPLHRRKLMLRAVKTRFAKSHSFQISKTKNGSSPLVLDDAEGVQVSVGV